MMSWTGQLGAGTNMELDTSLEGEALADEPEKRFSREAAGCCRYLS